MLVLAHETWPAGVIGIVASRLVEAYNRPAILIAAPPGQPARGSARSVEGCNITAAIAAQKEILIAFGGHPMAAGLAIEPERIPQFRRALAGTVREQCPEMQASASLRIDGYLDLADLSPGLVEEIERLAPFGPGNPPLTLASRSLRLRSRSVVGRSGDHVQLIVAGEDGNEQRVIWWQGASQPLPPGQFDLAYTVRTSNYRGRREVQVEWIDARPIAAASIEAQPEEPSTEVVDHRGAAQARQILERLRQAQDLQVWREGEDTLPGCSRYELVPGKVLAIWTPPPGPAQLRAALAAVSPQVVYLFGAGSVDNRPQAFLRRLAGLLKHLLKRERMASIAALAAATAQRETTVRLGMKWMVESGHVTIVSDDGDVLILENGSGTLNSILPRTSAQLNALLQETAAYRAHFARASIESLLGSDS